MPLLCFVIILFITIFFLLASTAFTYVLQNFAAWKKLFAKKKDFAQ